ncbi:MAG TPA: hypothetical protein VKT80_04055, partial [Chloroflexota bacterium]|nr:hypothetical protein [Chloroflexota bacterium]
PSADRTARVVASEGGSLEVEASVATAGLLVVDDVDYPGWRASIDGVPTAIYRADGIVRSVFVPGGDHLIKFWFDPPGLTLGSWFSSAAPTVLIYLVILELALRLIWLLGRLGLRRYRQLHHQTT